MTHCVYGHCAETHSAYDISIILSIPSMGPAGGSTRCLELCPAEAKSVVSSLSLFSVLNIEAESQACGL